MPPATRKNNNAPNAVSQTPTPSATSTPASAKRTGFSIANSGAKRKRLQFGTPDQPIVSDGATIKVFDINSTNKAFIHKVFPTSIADDLNMEQAKLPLSGFVIQPNVLFGDTMLGNVFYAKNTKDNDTIEGHKKSFFAANNNLPLKVVNTLDPETGLKRVYTSTTNNKVYAWQACAYVTDKEYTLTDDNIQKCVNNKLTDSAQLFYSTCPSVNKANTAWSHFPYVGNVSDPTCVFEHMRWSEVIADEDHIPFLINHALKQYFKGKPAIPRFRDWCKMDYRHIYCCWAPGAIPSDIIRKQNLDESCMIKSDWQKHMASLQEELKQQQELSKKLEAAKSDGGNQDYGEL